MKYECPCCGYFTFAEHPNGNYDICPVCFWEDDAIALDSVDEHRSCNDVSLTQARKNFIEFGACKSTMIPNVRPPKTDELNGVDLRARCSTDVTKKL